MGYGAAPKVEDAHSDISISIHHRLVAMSFLVVCVEGGNMGVSSWSFGSP